LIDLLIGQVRYELIGDTTARRLLAVNATSGELYARRDIARADLVDEIRVQVRVTDAGSPPLTTSVAFVVRLNVTGHQQLLDRRPTSTNLALPLVLVAAAAVVVVVACFLAARRVDPSRHVTDADYIAAPVTYLSRTSIDDLTCAGDCSTDVAVGSSVRIQVNDSRCTSLLMYICTVSC